MRKANQVFALCLAILCLLSVLPVSASAANAPDAITQTYLDHESKYRLQQSGSGPCVYYSCYMMSLRRMDIDGVGTSKASISAFQNVATSNGVNVYDNFTYSFGENSYTIRRIRLHKNGNNRYFYPALRKNISIANGLAKADDVKRLLITQLSLHPEGVVVWRANEEESYEHAVLVTKYNPTKDLFWCTDPATGKDRYLADALEASGDSAPSDVLKRQDYILKRINSLYIIASSKLASDKHFTVKYDANGGTGTMADSTFTYGETAQLSPCTFTREGYQFKGWWAIRAFDNRWRCKMSEPGWPIYQGSSVSTKATSMVWAKTDELFTYLGITEPALYADGASVKNMGLIDGGSITFKAQWEKVPDDEQDRMPPFLTDIWAYNNDAEKTDAMGAFARPGSTVTVGVAATEEDGASISLTLGMVNPETGETLELTSGTLPRQEDDTYEFDCNIPAETREGIWELTSATVRDEAGNASQYLTAEQIPGDMWFVVSKEKALLAIWEERWEDDLFLLQFSFHYNADFVHMDESAVPPRPKDGTSVYAVAWYDTEGKLVDLEPLQSVMWYGDRKETMVLQTPQDAAGYRLFALSGAWNPMCASYYSTKSE